MNEIDSQIIHVCTTYFREKSEVPKLALVHPAWYAKKSLSKVTLVLPPRLLFLIERPEDVGALPLTPVHIDVPLFELDLMTLPGDLKWRYVLPEEYWVIPQSRRDILRGQELLEERKLPPGMTMASLMAITPEEQDILQQRRDEEQWKRKYEGHWID